MTWVFNTKEGSQMFNAYRETDYWSVLDSPPKDMEVNIVRASRSDRWSPDNVSKLERLSGVSGGDQISGKVFYHILQNAGRWLHVDNPEGLADILRPSLVTLTRYLIAKNDKRGRVTKDGRC